jgi:hypothetical protein
MIKCWCRIQLSVVTAVIVGIRDPRSMCKVFVVDKVVLGNVCHQVLRLSSINIISPMFHIHYIYFESLYSCPTSGCSIKLLLSTLNPRIKNKNVLLSGNTLDCSRWRVLFGNT